MSQITYKKLDDGREILVINEKHFENEDSNLFSLPKDVISNVPMADFPVGLSFNYYEIKSEHPGCHCIEQDGVFTNVSKGKVVFYFNELRRGKFWREDYSLVSYHRAIEQALKIVSVFDAKLSFKELEDSGDDYLYLKFNIEISSQGTVQDCITKILEIRKLIEEEALRIVKGISFDESNLRDEKLFTLNVVMPILRAMGMVQIQYNHGVREYGKDITFSEQSKWGTLRHYGVQVKAGDVSGGASGAIDGLASQLNDAFSMSYIAVSGAEKRYVHDMIIAISGRFTKNAKEKILEKVHSSLHGRRNVLFFSIDEWKTLADRHVRLIEDTQTVSSVILSSILKALDRLEEGTGRAC